MRFFINAVDRFCAKHPRFGIDKLILYIIIGNAVVYLFSVMDTTGTLLGLLYFDPSLILKGQIWRLFSFVFVSGYSSFNSLIWFALFLYFYYFIGTALEREWGAGKFTLYYLFGVLLTIVYGLVVCALTGSWGALPLTANYINLAMFFAYATIFPEQRVLFMFIIPVKIKWLAYLDAAYFLLQVILGAFPMNLLPLVAILNYLLFFAPELIGGVKRIGFRYNKNVIHFRSAAKKAASENRAKGYNRKCAVCGRTDADYPNLEFRYCSRCAGYHCFCEDHINSHVHFTE